MPSDRLLVDDGKVGLRVVEVEGIDVVCRVTEGGPVSDNKGLSLPGMNVSVPAMCEKDIGRPGVRARPAGRRHRAVLRAQPGRHRPRPQDHGREGAAAAGDRQAGEARGGRQPRGHRARVRRRHGRPRRPGRRAAAGARAAGAEARDPDRPGERQAGDRRDPDAGLDDHELAADPGRGVRRRQRGARRRRRPDALRRDQRRPLPDQVGAHDGPDHRGGRGAGRSTSRRCSTCRAPSAACSPTPPATSASGSRRGRWSRSPSPATPCAGWPGCTPGCRCWRSPRCPRCAASSR